MANRDLSILSRVYMCFVAFSFITSACVYCLTDTFTCGPFGLCSCVTHESSGLVNMDCSHSNLHLEDVCNYTSNRTNFTEVIFNSNNVSTIRKKDVNGCEHVEVFVLRNVSLRHVTTDAFVNLKQLRILDISENKLDIYTGDKVSFLNNMTKLRELNIRGNIKVGRLTNVTTYPALSNLPKLETLYVDGLPDISFTEDYRRLQHLATLILSGLNGGICNLGDLVNTTYDTTPHLTHLHLSNCSITNIHAGTFKMLHNLTKLDLSMNQGLGFNSMRNISYDLQFTKIDFLSISKLHNTFGLGTQLRLSDVCYLRNTTLRELVLDSNRLETVDTNTVLVMPETLQVLHVRDNKLTFGLYLLQLACFSNLTTVYAGLQYYGHAPLHYLEDPLPGATFMSPSNGHCIYETPEYLYNISKTIPGCRYFKTEQIAKSDLYSATFPKQLKILLLHDSTMHSRFLPYPIQPFDNHIEYIDISGNILYSWIGPIGPFAHLKSLNPSRNYCSYIGPDFFLYLSSLQRLYIEKNFLGITLTGVNAGEVFKPLTNLEVIDLSSNQIRYLPSNVFEYLVKLRILNMSFNSIYDWNMDVQNLQDLEYVAIQSNALSELPESLTSHFDKIQSGLNKSYSIDMRNNPIRCSCKYERFLTWMVKHRSSFIGFDQYNFTDDSGNRMTVDTFIHRVENFTKACRSFTLVIIICTVGVTLFLSLIICGLIYKNRWKLRYLLYMNKRRFFGYRTIPDYEPIENFRYDAFISYAEEDIRFILDGIIPNLEMKGLGLCIHERDFIAGNAVTENIINAIQSSKKTVVILTRAFLKSKWCRYEFQMARMESIYSRDGNSSVIIVMLENMPPNKLMPLEMIEWIKQESYIEYTDDEQGKELFWENLKQGILQ